MHWRCAEIMLISRWDMLLHCIKIMEESANQSAHETKDPWPYIKAKIYCSDTRDVFNIISIARVHLHTI